MEHDPVVIVGARRTPMGAFQGQLSDLPATALGSKAIAAAVEQAELQPWEISEVVMGCVLPAGLGQAPARQASLGAGLAREVPATTVNKMCGSGMKAVMLAYDQIRAGSADIMVAGGMESMTRRDRAFASAMGARSTICFSMVLRMRTNLAASWVVSPRTRPKNCSSHGKSRTSSHSNR
jgi:acetyl-CoA C-acetyltransferase